MHLSNAPGQDLNGSQPASAEEGPGAHRSPFSALRITFRRTCFNRSAQQRDRPDRRSFEPQKQSLSCHWPKLRMAPPIGIQQAASGITFQTPAENFRRTPGFCRHLRIRFLTAMLRIVGYSTYNCS
ncbi:Hypothetical predicted protein [Podarcis lilfordi]|uniref:Uncharacterized protein n=1 Tax=Podarcis lilfordi TaxID=74358 RepID=A0AA35LBM4_9SAUR|nr:Hypothetical predicted protein [Podarcis lilfordi]CAI5793337.1 Hypothetical predicted protein [Podarcis lilfordi]